MTREKIVSLAKRCGAYVYKDGDAVFNSTDIEIFYHAAIANFLKKSGQYITNDASREAVIKQAKAEAFEAAAKSFEDSTQSNVLFTVYQVAAAIREMAKEMK